MVDRPETGIDPLAIRVEELPRYRDAINQESRERTEPFIPGFPRFICGIEVLMLTSEHLALLRAQGSPFIYAEKPQPSVVQVMQFLWCISPEYATAQALRNRWLVWFPRLANWLFNRVRARFARRFRKLDYWEAVKESQDYMDRAFADAPGPGNGGEFTPAYFSSEASTIIAIAEITGWSKREIMKEPVECLWQYFRAVKKRNEPGCSFPNRSDKIRLEELRKALKGAGHG